MFNILTFTGFHTWLSLIALASGALLIVDLLTSRLASRLTILFFVTAIATNVTGFMFPFAGLLPSHVVGIISSLVLLLALLARYGFHLAGAWRWVYAVTLVVGVYFLAFVAIAQICLKVPFLAAMGQLPFAIAEAVLLIVTIVLAIKAAKAYCPAMMVASA